VVNDDDEYTPTTDEVRVAWILSRDYAHGAEFDRWLDGLLAAHDAEVAERIAQAIEDIPGRDVAGHPHGAGYVRAHAARIAREAGRS